MINEHPRRGNYLKWSQLKEVIKMRFAGQWYIYGASHSVITTGHHAQRSWKSITHGHNYGNQPYVAKHLTFLTKLMHAQNYIRKILALQKTWTGMTWNGQKHNITGGRRRNAHTPTSPFIGNWAKRFIWGNYCNVYVRNFIDAHSSTSKQVLVQLFHASIVHVIVLLCFKSHIIHYIHSTANHTSTDAQKLCRVIRYT